MSFRNFITVLALVALLTAPVWAEESFKPEWHVGQTWTIEAQYKNQLREGDSWLKPIQWRFEVKSEKEIEGVPCFVLYVTPAERSDLKVQAILCVAKNDLRPVKVVDVFPVQGKAQARERVIDPSRLTPLLSNEALIPYDMPLFPLQADVEAEKVTSGAVGGENAVNVDDITFVDSITQSWTPTAAGYQIKIQTGGAKGELTQEWAKDQPWATKMTSENVTFTLVRP